MRLCKKKLLFDIKTECDSPIAVKTHYPELQNYMVLILTHCEDKSEAERHQLAQEIRANHNLADLVDCFARGIWCMGAISLEARTSGDLTRIEHLTDSVLDMQNNFVQALCYYYQYFNIHRIAGTTAATTAPNNDNSLRVSPFQHFELRDV